MKRSDCFNCHAVETKVVGPAYLEVANKYRGQPEALKATVQRVIKGSSGVWGEAPMLPHESFSSEQVQLMVQWVFGLKPGQTGANLVRGLSGRIAAVAEQAAGEVELEATYADLGRPPAGSLAGTGHVKLRSRRTEAERADLISGPEREENDQASGRFLLAKIRPAHFVRFDDLNLADSSSVTCRVANGGGKAVLELHEGTRPGPLLATIAVPPTGGWDKWVELSAPLLGLGHRGPLWVTFDGSATNRLLNWDWIQFNPRE
jgi:cytochrome c